MYVITKLIPRCDGCFIEFSIWESRKLFEEFMYVYRGNE